ncbi:filament-like plant protein 1 [Selaginella moellendorffii]|uniref:filament-like plant protein 1 n=1 Tax=Selaginella moellendorffii TaxID=88036 RepID=UPI000D1CE49A|nr:filament-like plant protein 1 [Selaginella moellendorffii]|eukprot:XP_024518288.1 filament-like plant protein 1 [Selaginella moellendorffii]
MADYQLLESHLIKTEGDLRRLTEESEVKSTETLHLQTLMESLGKERDRIDTEDLHKTEQALQEEGMHVHQAESKTAELHVVKEDLTRMTCDIQVIFSKEREEEELMVSYQKLCDDYQKVKLAAIEMDTEATTEMEQKYEHATRDMGGLEAQNHILTDVLEERAQENETKNILMRERLVSLEEQDQLPRKDTYSSILVHSVCPSDVAKVDEERTQLQKKCSELLARDKKAPPMQPKSPLSALRSPEPSGTPTLKSTLACRHDKKEVLQGSSSNFEAFDLSSKHHTWTSLPEFKQGGYQDPAMDCKAIKSFPFEGMMPCGYPMCSSIKELELQLAHEKRHSQIVGKKMIDERQVAERILKERQEFWEKKLKDLQKEKYALSIRLQLFKEVGAETPRKRITRGDDVVVLTGEELKRLKQELWEQESLIKGYQLLQLVYDLEQTIAELTSNKKQREREEEQAANYQQLLFEKKELEKQLKSQVADIRSFYLKKIKDLAQKLEKANDVKPKKLDELLPYEDLSSQFNVLKDKIQDMEVCHQQKELEWEEILNETKRVYNIQQDTIERKWELTLAAKNAEDENPRLCHAFGCHHDDILWDLGSVAMSGRYFVDTDELARVICHLS